MNFSTLSSNEKLAVYGSLAVIIGAIVGYGYGVGLLAILAAIGMLAVVFLPQMSPGTNLPGTKGSLMLLAGGIAGVILVLTLLIYIGTIFTATNLRDILFLIAVAGGVLMAWAGWQEFQSEGGKFQLGNAAAPSSTPPPANSSTATSDVPAATPPPAPAAPTTPSAPPTAPAPSSDTEMDNRP
jgi:hypothetical protein